MKKYKIGLCSTMSCGKTTLVKELSKLPEFKNYFVATERSQYLRDLGIPLNTDSTIFGQSLFASERCSELMRDSLLTDRTIIDVMAFTNLSKTINNEQKINFETLYKDLIKEYDYIFYISPLGIPIEDNGIREIDPEYRMEIDKEIRNLLEKYKKEIKNFHTIYGPTPQRIKQVLEILSL